MATCFFYSRVPLPALRRGGGVVSLPSVTGRFHILDISDRMSSLTEKDLLNVSASEVVKKARAKFIPDADGALRLVMVQSFSFPIFREDGFEEVGREVARRVTEESDDEDGEKIIEEYKRRATRRAKVNALDMILCNDDLDTFCTFTYRPEGNDRASYEDCYKKLSVWLSNGVQRRDLKYIAVPEHHKDGENIHFHMVANSAALKLTPAVSPRGTALYHTNGERIYNVTDWRHGFSTAVPIGGAESDRDRVAKYVFKYMGKQSGQMIGGRYFLHGGKLKKPIFVLADDPEVFFYGQNPQYHREINICDGATYKEWSFL